MGACISILEKAGNAEKLSNRVMELEKENADLQAALACQGGRTHHGQPQQAQYTPPPQAGGGVCEVLFFPDKGMPCRNFLQGRECRRQGCEYVHEQTSLVRLLGWFGQATSSIDVCVFTITCNEIADGLVAAHQRGVRVRVISDNDQAGNQGSDIGMLRDAGIPVRLDKDQYHMHHKFAVLDNRYVINGSFNWTRQAVLNNQENTTVSDNPQLVQRFVQQFENLWRKFQ